MANDLLVEGGVTRILHRYPLNVLATYASFLLLLRLWLSYISRAYRAPIEVVGFDQSPAAPPAEEEKSQWSVWDSVDVPIPDDACGCLLGLLILLIVVLGGAALGILIEAPLILAEAAFQFLLAAGLLRCAKPIDRPDWVGRVFERTWKPFAAVLAATLILGCVSELACKEPTDLRSLINSCRAHFYGDNSRTDRNNT